MGSTLSLPPQNVDVEEAILGGILLDPDAIARVIDILPPEAFFTHSHQEIYRACIKLHEKNQPTDLMNVVTHLLDHNRLELVGGQQILVHLVDRTVS
ncbi:MAG TPA: DnaB-like helicase N-terminal domain-containing protein, partial [Cyanophyceae cyanobacterium]